jgi:hypothetical protein
MKRRRARLQPTSSAIDDILAGDYPEVVKVAARLAFRGARWSKQHCLKCGKRGRHLQIYIPSALLSPVLPEETRHRIRFYWLCEAHRGTLSEEEVCALLRGQRPSGEPLGAPGAGERRGR